MTDRKSVDIITQCDNGGRSVVSFANLLTMCQELGRRGVAVRNDGGRIVIDSSQKTELAQAARKLSCQLGSGLLESDKRRFAYHATEEGPRMKPQWKFVIDNERGMRSLCGKHSKGNSEVADDLFSLCIERMPGIFGTYDESKSAIRTHVFTALNFYCAKWISGRDNKHTGRMEVSLSDLAITPWNNKTNQQIAFDIEARVNLDFDKADEVNHILSSLDKYDSLLLMMKHIQGLTFEEIAEVTEQTKGTTRNHYLAAMARARVIMEKVIK